MVRQGKEAVGVWKRYFQNVLNEGGRSEVQGDEGGEEVNGGNELLNEDVTREEVKQALDTLKRKAAPGSDRLTAEMVCSDVLVDFWCSLFMQLVLAGRMGWFPRNGEEAPWSPYQRGVEVGYARQRISGAFHYCQLLIRRCAVLLRIGWCM